MAVVKLHAHAVRTGCKDTTHALELNVLNFLSGAQDGDEVKVPNVRDWANRTMDGIEQTKEYYDARMSSRKGSMKATAPAAQETTKPSDTTKPVQAFDQSNWVPGKCVKCKREFRGPPVDRQGGDPSTTWYKLCRACKSSDGSGGKFMGGTKDVHQVEQENSTDDYYDEGPLDIYGPCELDVAKRCYMVDVHRSEQERVTNQVLNVLTDGRTNKCIIDVGVIVDSGAAVSLTNLLSLIHI